MTVTTRATLLQLLVAGYDDLKGRLTRRLGSADLASEALQDTYVRLQCIDVIGSVQNPQAYLARMAYNMATNRRVAESRHPRMSERDALLDIADDAPDVVRAVEARSEVELLKRTLAEMPKRRREIFLAASVEEVPYAEIARRFDISIRTVQNELGDALAHCILRLDRQPTKICTKRPRRLSSV